MIRRGFVLGLLGVAGLTSVLASVAFAAEQKTESVTGTIKRVCVKSRSLVLTVGTEKNAKDVTMKVCPKAKIQIDGKEVKLDAVKAGATATAQTGQTKMKDGTPVAVCLTIGKGTCPHSAGSGK